MIESGYYPPGAEFDPNAPYNQRDNDEVEISVSIFQTLRKEGTPCYTTDYNPTEDGNDFNDTNWREVAIYNNISTPLEIINEFGKLLDKLSKTQMFGNKYISHWKEQCAGWTEEDFDVYGD